MAGLCTRCVHAVDRCGHNTCVTQRVCAPFIISNWVPIVKNWCGGDYSIQRVHVRTSHAECVQ